MSNPYPPTPTNESPSSVPVTREQPVSAPAPRSRPVVPVGTLMVVAFLFLNIVFLWMLVLGIQQGRA